jgi:hypothetical protein
MPRLVDPEDFQPKGIPCVNYSVQKVMVYVPGNFKKSPIPCAKGASEEEMIKSFFY